MLLGGEAALASYLNISRLRLELYLKGTALCPAEVARKVACLLLEDELSSNVCYSARAGFSGRESSRLP